MLNMISLFLPVSLILNTDICGIDSINLQENDTYKLTTPLYPRTYPDYLDCHWIVTAADDGHIIMHIIDFATEFNYDFLSIGSGYEVGYQNSTRHSMSGESVPTQLSIEGAVMWIRFTSDRRYGDKGAFMTLTCSASPGISHFVHINSMFATRFDILKIVLFPFVTLHM